jgi:protein-tyrosine phosphatase
MAIAARQQGIELVGRARQFMPEDFERFDWIVAMDHSNYADILALDSARQHSGKVKQMCDFCRQYADREVPDPYYGGADGFSYVIDLLFDACTGFLDFLQEQP